MSNTTPPGPGGPEYLESSAGAPVGPAERSSSDSRKRVLALGGLVGVLAVGGGAVWAASSFLATGSQPAEAMPAGTLGYVSIDLDPSGGQKIEAIKTLRKFPAFKEEIGLETDDDLREAIVEELVKSGECEGLDYAKDVEPWLGDRAGVGMVALGAEDEQIVFVAQVKDADQAVEGLDNLREVCAGGSEEESGGWVIDGDWVVVADDEAAAQRVVDATEKGSLADDEDFKKWTSDAGDAGIVSMYAAPEAGEFLGRYLGDMAGMGSMFGMPSEYDMGIDPETGELEDPSAAPETPALPSEMQEALADFGGAAATVRFDDGGLEVEMAYSNMQDDLTKNFLGAAGVDMVEGLPEDTVAAFGLGFEEGWAQSMLDYLAESSGSELDMDELMAEAEADTGLALPEDLETMFGEGVAVGLGSGIDADAIINGGPNELPLGVKIKGDAGEIQAVLDKMKELAGPEVAPYLEVTESDGYAIIGTSDDYKAELESEGSLGSSEAYGKVIEDDAVSVLFVNFDADDDWLSRISKDEPEVSENLAPLAAFGISGWADGDVLHAVYKVTTN